MTDLIAGMFDTKEAAETAISKLQSLGYGRDEIDVAMESEGKDAGLLPALGRYTTEGLGLGAAIGALIVACLAGLLAAGSISVPEVGLAHAGLLAAILSGAGAGGLGGALIGGLIGTSLPEKAKPADMRPGIVVTVAVHSEDEGRVRRALHSDMIRYTDIRYRPHPAPLSAAGHDDLSLPLE
jgi:hypothetical protein